ncbi:MAG: hypothetical protein Fur0043_19070 [Anaerolineales bacterium]
MTEPTRPLKVFLCHIIPLWDARADRVPVRGLYSCLTNDGVDIMPVGYAWLDKAKLHGERSRTILPGQGFDRLNLSDWELEIRKAVHEAIDV